VFLLAMLEFLKSSVFPLVNTVLLFGGLMLPEWRVKVIFKALCYSYIVLSYYVLCVFLFIFILFTSSELMCFLSPMLVCNLSLSCCEAL
jgi:hypothetical protein